MSHVTSIQVKDYPTIRIALRKWLLYYKNAMRQLHKDWCGKPLRSSTFDETVSKLMGFKDWNTFSAEIGTFSPQTRGEVSVFVGKITNALCEYCSMERAGYIPDPRPFPRDGIYIGWIDFVVDYCTYTASPVLSNFREFQKRIKEIVPKDDCYHGPEGFFRWMDYETPPFPYDAYDSHENPWDELYCDFDFFLSKNLFALFMLSEKTKVPMDYLMCEDLRLPEDRYDGKNFSNGYEWSGRGDKWIVPPQGFEPLEYSRV